MSYTHSNGDGERIFTPIFADVWETNLKHMSGADVKVYIALLMHTTQQDRTWFLSLEELAVDAGVGRDTARVAKDRLIKEGLVSQSWRYRDEGGVFRVTEVPPPPRMQAKNLYRVSVKPVQGLDSRGLKSAPIEAENQPLVEAENQQQTRTPSPEPPPTKTLGESGDSPTVTKRAPYSPEFEEFWRRYPKRSGSKKNASEQFGKAVARVGIDVVMGGVDRLTGFVGAGHREPRFVRNAERWLMDDMWEEELAPGTLAQFRQQSGPAPRRVTWSDLAKAPVRPVGRQPDDFHTGHHIIDSEPF